MIVHKDNIRKAAELLSRQNSTQLLKEEMGLRADILMNASKAHLFTLLFGHQYEYVLMEDQKINMVLAKY